MTSMTPHGLLLLGLLACTRQADANQPGGVATNAGAQAHLIDRAYKVWSIQHALLENTTSGKDTPSSSCCRCDGCDGCSFSNAAQRRLSPARFQRTDCCKICTRPAATRAAGGWAPISRSVLAGRPAPRLAAGAAGEARATAGRAATATRAVAADGPGGQPIPSQPLNQEFNLVGDPLQPCNADKVNNRTTGFYQNGACQVDPLQHVACVTLSEEFLFMTEDIWLAEYMKPNVNWCIPAWAWASAVARDPKNREGLKLHCEASNSRLRDIYQDYGIFESPTGNQYPGEPALAQVDQLCGEAKVNADSQYAGVLSPDRRPWPPSSSRDLSMSAAQVYVPPEMDRSPQYFLIFMIASVAGIFLTFAALTTRCPGLRYFVPFFALAPVGVFFFACSGPDFDYLHLHYKY